MINKKISNDLVANSSNEEGKKRGRKKIEPTSAENLPKTRRRKTGGAYDDYLESVKEICDLALTNGDLRSAISAKKLEADWIKQNKDKDKQQQGTRTSIERSQKFGINAMSDEELENLIAELEESVTG